MGASQFQPLVLSQPALLANVLNLKRSGFLDVPCDTNFTSLGGRCLALSHAHPSTPCVTGDARIWVSQHLTRSRILPYFVQRRSEYRSRGEKSNDPRSVCVNGSLSAAVQMNSTGLDVILRRKPQMSFKLLPPLF